MEQTLDPNLTSLYQLNRDAVYTKLHPRKKHPQDNAWQDRPYSPEMVVHEHRNSRTNIGLINGAISGIVDVDLDCPEAARLAEIAEKVTLSNPDAHAISINDIGSVLGAGSPYPLMPSASNIPLPLHILGKL